KTVKKNSKKNSNKTQSNLDYVLIAKRAADDLREWESSLVLDGAIGAHDTQRRGAVSRLPAAAIAIAIDIAERHPQEFAFFDVRAAREAIAYEQALAPVAAQARQTAVRIENSITKRRKTPVDQTLALYAAVKGYVRVPQGEPLIPQYQDMKRIVTTHHRK